jgi:hypothetical protein
MSSVSFVKTARYASFKRPPASFKSLKPSLIPQIQRCSLKNDFAAHDSAYTLFGCLPADRRLSLAGILVFLAIAFQTSEANLRPSENFAIQTSFLPRHSVLLVLHQVAER